MKARQAEARADIEAEKENQYLDAVDQEARRRSEESHGNDGGAIYRAMMDGTYAALIGEFRDEVEAEWNEADCETSSQVQESAEPDGETALLMLIRDPENDGALAKLARYEASLMNAFTRTLQHLHLLQAKQNATKLISV